MSMVIFAMLALCGFITALFFHLTLSIGSTVALRLPDPLISVVYWLGLALFLSMLFTARSWTLGEFLVNLFDEMPWLSKALIAIVVLYALLIQRSAGTVTAQVMHPEYYHAPAQMMWRSSALLMAGYFCSFCYFWKERPQ